MDSDQSLQPSQNPSWFPKSRPVVFYISSLLILFLAISFGHTKLNHRLRLSIFTSCRTLPHKLLGFLQSTHITNPNSISPNCVLWMAPFLSGGGYSSEAWSYILSLRTHLNKNPNFSLVIEQHGDLENLEYWEGLPKEVQNLALKLYRTQCIMNKTIVICHSEPGAWYPPLFQTLPCPPNGYGNVMTVIGRTMFETDRLNHEHVRRCNQMDFVWVPTEFHVSTFVKSGVDPKKVVKIIQPIDIKFFDPSKYTPLNLASKARLILGLNPSKLKRKEFVFLSVFKWEYRKGWDVLLESYLKEFSECDGVSLYLLTNPYHTNRDFSNKIMDFVVKSGIQEPVSGWSPIYVIDTHIAQIDLPRLYKSADAFVMPSRGEGWGRPIVEAMAMALPVIATNWSGPTEYLTEENSYPLSVDRMSEVIEGPFKGHLWAEPSVDRLRVLMRHVRNNVEEGMVKGRTGREDMINKFSPEIVAGIVADQIQKLIKLSTR